MKNWLIVISLMFVAAMVGVGVAEVVDTVWGWFEIVGG